MTHRVHLWCILDQVSTQWDGISSIFYMYSNSSHFRGWIVVICSVELLYKKISVKSKTCCNYNLGTPVVHLWEFFFLCNLIKLNVMLYFHHMYDSVCWYYDSMNRTLAFHALLYNIFMNAFLLFWWMNSFNMLIMTLSLSLNHIHNEN